mmetsp:Transcript_118611/g.185185  ORF Transcript_118611/g.185185 Transcript_118611/m.185185 type:complete len:247 (-) Transcript_118611:139-879(-)|eukprot:CAMPEP_0169359362 /NCGR_PEP_ID=MMETSP1017-20121227/29176_1 /TAXON_ID=342587 /ORGANISM="Karlodinium micrum, Strain CCMP2283" /LENGTH=246 /DNA_ID=CAMNT_0009456493 /DNA_START=49 /DNA_END=789 /DNA_ORIENTATION=-
MREGDGVIDARGRGLSATTESRRLRRGLIVGQSPPRPLEQLPPAYQAFQGPPEQRLTKLAGFETPKDLWAVFDRLDLIGWCPEPKPRADKHDVKKGYTKHNWDGHRFPLRFARLAASRLLNFGRDGTSLQEYAIVVLCGRNVAAAFGLKLRPFVPWAEERDGVRYLVMPHPSGVSHLWNDAVCRHRAIAAFRAALEVAGLQPPTAAPSPPLALPQNLPATEKLRRKRRRKCDEGSGAADPQAKVPS